MTLCCNMPVFRNFFYVTMEHPLSEHCFLGVINCRKVFIKIQPKKLICATAFLTSYDCCLSGFSSRKYMQTHKRKMSRCLKPEKYMYICKQNGYAQDIFGRKLCFYSFSAICVQLKCSIFYISIFMAELKLWL